MFPQAFLLGMVLLAAGSPEVDLPAREGTKSLPCGLSSLYFLEHLCGKELSLDDVRAHLRTDVDGHCSFRDIVEAGHRTGLKLVAYQLRPADPIDRPMIVSLQNGKRGHFVVVRPVGHTGKLVQVLNYPDDPALLDESVFRFSGQWTGIVLAPMSPRPLLPYALMLLGILLCVLAWYFRHREPTSTGHAAFDPGVESFRPTKRPKGNRGLPFGLLVSIKPWLWWPWG